MPPLTLPTPVHDKDTKSSKNESKLRQCHLWNEEGSIGVTIVNPILTEIPYNSIRPVIFGPTTTNVWKASATVISESHWEMAITDGWSDAGVVDVFGRRENMSISNHHAMSPCEQFQMETHLTEDP